MLSFLLNMMRSGKRKYASREFQCDDAEYLFVAYGTSARVCQKSVQIAREQGIKAGLLRPITLFPFPSKRLSELADKV